MKKALLILLVFSAVLFIDYLLLIAFGWSAFKFGAQDQFYCGAYCQIAISILIISFVGVVMLSKKILKKDQFMSTE